MSVRAAAAWVALVALQAARDDAPRVVARIGDLAVTADAFAAFVLDERATTATGSETLDALVQERMVEVEAGRRHLAVDDGAIDERVRDLDERLRRETGGKQGIESLRNDRKMGLAEFRAMLRKTMLAERMMAADFGLPVGAGVPPEKQSLWFHDQNRPAVKREALPAGVAADVAGSRIGRVEWGLRLFGQLADADQNALFEDYVGIALLLQRGRQLRIEVTPARIQAEIDERTRLLQKMLEQQGMPTDGVDYLSTIKARGDDPAVVLKSDRIKAEVLLKEIARELHGRDGFRSFYEARRVDFDRQFGRRVRVSSIFLVAAAKKSEKVPRNWFEATGELDRIKDRLAADPAALAASFAAQARTRSEDGASAKLGGDLGFVGLREIEQHGFEPTLLDERSGSVVGPVNTRNGVHLLLIGEKRAASPFEEIREEVEKAARRELLRDLKKDVKIEREI